MGAAATPIETVIRSVIPGASDTIVDSVRARMRWAIVTAASGLIPGSITANSSPP